MTAGGIALVAAAALAAAVCIALLLLLRAQDRLVLAPLYGGGALAVSELAQSALTLRDVTASPPAAARASTVLLAAATGMGAAAVTAAGVRVAPARSVGLTVVGAAALVAAMVLVLRLARRRAGPAEQSAGAESSSDGRGIA